MTTQDSHRFTTIAIMFATACITALTIAYFITIRQDGTVFTTATTTIATIVGYMLGARSKEKE
jgi:hypothetical protein